MFSNWRMPIAAPALAALLTLFDGTTPADLRAQTNRVIEVIADKDNTFKVAGQSKPVITATPGETLMLKVTSYPGPERAKDGATHSLVIKKLRNLGWDLRLGEGTQAFTVRAPDAPGEYLIECTVKCGRGHEEMRMKLIVK